MTELGTLRFGETQVDEAMHQIVMTTHQIFDVDGAGLMLVDDEDRLRNVAVSDTRFEHLERVQLEHDEGPCISSFRDRELVCVEDLRTDERWPAFASTALSSGICAVLASPIPYNQQAIGVVGVVSEDRHPWSPEGELALLAFTDLAALLIASMVQAEEQGALATQLQGALDSRAAIEQAKGVLMHQHGISAREAFDRIRSQARTERRKVRDIAVQIVDNGRS